MNNFNYQNFSDKQKEIYDKYKGNHNSFCYNLNDYLRFDEKAFASFQDEITILDEILEHTKNEKSITLFRATNDRLVDPFIENGFYINPEYLSTSYDEESIQNHFKNPTNPIFLLLHCKIGTNMISLEMNNRFSGLEKEILLGRNNKFKIKSDDIITDRNQIEEIMGRYNAIGVNSIRKIKMTNNI